MLRSRTGVLGPPFTAAGLNSRHPADRGIRTAHRDCRHVSGRFELICSVQVLDHGDPGQVTQERFQMLWKIPVDPYGAMRPAIQSPLTSICTRKVLLTAAPERGSIRGR